MTEKHVVVTGANGFLGKYVSQTFSKNGFSVTGLGHGSWSRAEWQKWGLSEWHSCHITMDSLRTYVEEPGIIVHCAGSGSVGYSMTHPMQDFERTVTTTLTILEFLRLHSPGTSFVYPSSAAVYGIADHLPIGESSALHPISPYGVHKRIVEEISDSYGLHFNIPIAIARFFSLYGPMLRKQLLWDACSKISRGDLHFHGTGSEIRDWLHVRDAARLMLVLSSHASPEAVIVNGGTGTGVTVREIVESVMRKMDIRSVPAFSQKPRTGDPPGYVADIRKAAALGWKPEIALEDGIGEYVDWFRSGGL